MTKDDKLRNVVKTVTVSTFAIAVAITIDETAEVEAFDCASCSGNTMSLNGCSCDGACSTPVRRWVY